MLPGSWGPRKRIGSGVRPLASNAPSSAPLHTSESSFLIAVPQPSGARPLALRLCKSSGFVAMFAPSVLLLTSTQSGSSQDMDQPEDRLSPTMHQNPPCPANVASWEPPQFPTGYASGALGGRVGAWVCCVHTPLILAQLVCHRRPGIGGRPLERHEVYAQRPATEGREAQTVYVRPT